MLFCYQIHYINTTTLLRHFLLAYSEFNMRLQMHKLKYIEEQLGKLYNMEQVSRALQPCTTFRGFKITPFARTSAKINKIEQLTNTCLFPLRVRV